MHALPRDPGSVAQRCKRFCLRVDFLVPHHGLILGQPRLQFFERSFSGFAADSTKEVDLGDLGEALTQPCGLRATFIDRFLLQLGTQRLGHSAGVPGDLLVVGIAGLIEQLADLIIRKPVDEAGLAQERLTATFDDLAQQPFEILLGPFAHGERMHGILDRDRADPLQPAPDLDPEIGGLRRQLVDQQQPTQAQRSCSSDIHKSIMYQA